jgi:glycine/D-amino acid oxidase-like deaminating enzyme
MYSVIIVGGGVSAASVVYHLYSIPNFKSRVLLLESGEIGRGNKLEFSTNENLHEKSEFGEETTYKPWLSGSNVFDNPGRIKMIVTIFPSTAKEFVRHHGMKGLRLYNKLSSLGRNTEIRLADLFLNKIHNYSVGEKENIPDQAGCIQLGSLMVCYENEVTELQEEFKILNEGGFEVEWWDKDRVESIHGKTAEFSAGIFFPKDGVINSNLYSKKLIEYGVEKGLEVREKSHVSEVLEIKKNGEENVVKIVLDSGETIYANKVVMATGGLFLDKALLGILKPCYSYLTGIKNDNLIKSVEEVNMRTMRNSPNFFTYGFSHDWCMAQGYLRISGEDHFSALKNPRLKYRCQILEKWGKSNYDFLKHSSNVIYENGVYSETPDILPLVGKMSDNSNIVYIVGCNAWGQASMSGAAYLIPAILGERNIEKEEQEMIDFLSIRRFKSHGFGRPKF